MKKNILSLIIMVVVCTAANAQSIIYGGFKANANYSLYNKALDGPIGTVNQRSGIGYGIGYYEVIELPNRINLQAEVNLNTIAFSQKDTTNIAAARVAGQKASFNKESFRYTNLELPFMIKYRVTDNLAIGVGYQFNIFNNRFRKGKKTTVVTPVVGDETRTSVDLEEGTDPIPATEGFIVDASFKSNNIIAGLRLLSADDPLRTVSYFNTNGAVERKANLNVSLYVGITLFK
jgi:hypothetical protein